MIEIEQKEYLDVPPVLNKKMFPVKGKDTVQWVQARASIAQPVIITSDLHYNAGLLVDKIVEKIENPQQWIFISAGDMAGTGVLGSNGDSIPVLEKARDSFKAIYFVHGNHDLESPHSCGLRNYDKSYCHLHNKVQEIEGLGKIAGLDGIISSKKKLHRFPRSTYLSNLQTLCSSDLDWLITHEVPNIPDISGKPTGDVDLSALVIEGKVKKHVFGHCHFKNWHGRLESTYFFNVDSRIVCLQPF